VSLLVVGVILYGAWPLFRESLDVILESTPPGISAAHVAATVEAIPGVKNVHDLHIWAVEPRLIMLTCHVLVDGDDEALTDALLRAIRAKITSDFGIHHMTIQMGTSCCRPATAHCDLSKLVSQQQDSHPLHVHR